MSLFKPYNIVILVMKCLAPTHWAVRAYPIWLLLLFCLANAQSDMTTSDGIKQRNLPLQNREYGKFLLRIMPLGASITLGYKSTDGNGYREWLRRQLRVAGWQVDMVGSMRNGTMHDNASSQLPQLLQLYSKSTSVNHPPGTRRSHRTPSRPTRKRSRKNHPTTTKPDPYQVRRTPHAHQRNSQS